MRVFILLFSSFLIGQSYGGMILHNIRDNLHSKLYGHGLHGETPQTVQNQSPIINVNNYQQVSQQASHNQNQNQMHGFPPTHMGGHGRGDHGTLSNYGPHSYGGGGGFMNSNIKAGGLKYDNFGGYGNHNSMKQESYYHREGPKFGQHHDTNMFGNAKIGSSSSSSSSASSSATSSSAGGSSSATSSSSSSSSVSGGDSHYNTRVKPWRY